MLTSSVSDHVVNRRNCGPLEGATHTGQGGMDDGPYIRIHLKVEEGVIRQASYETYGCPAAIASGSALCELVTRRPVEKALLLEPRDIDVVLGGLPEGKGDRPQWAVDALRRALGE